jgi:signal transduction histidine kinase
MHGEALGLVLVRSQAQFGTLEQRLRSKWAALLLAVAGSCFLLVTLIYRRTVAGSLVIAEERTQQELEQRSRLDKLAHFGRLAQEVVHEIKQPLTAMNARAFTLQKRVAPDSDAFRDAVVIRSEVKRLDRIVKDFLLLAKPSEPRLADLRAADALTEVRNLMAPHLAHDSIEFKFDCDDRLRFRADLAQIKQVLINLIKNAAECLVPSGGSVTLRAKAATEDRAGKATQVAVIEVEDTGPGIPIELQEKIFEPFFSTKGDGTGLGLAIATRIVDKHGGRLELDTELGRGTVFRIILPACPNLQAS